MTAEAKRVLVFQTIVLLWMVTSVLMVSALAWALFYPDGKRPGINLREL
jgi:hypothetical protein